MPLPTHSTVQSPRCPIASSNASSSQNMSCSCGPNPCSIWARQYSSHGRAWWTSFGGKNQDISSYATDRAVASRRLFCDDELADENGAIDLERVEQRHEVGGENGNRIAQVRIIRRAESALIWCDEAQRLRE